MKDSANQKEDAHTLEEDATNVEEDSHTLEEDTADGEEDISDREEKGLVWLTLRTEVATTWSTTRTGVRDKDLSSNGRHQECVPSLWQCQ